MKKENLLSAKTAKRAVLQLSARLESDVVSSSLIGPPGGGRKGAG